MRSQIKLRLLALGAQLLERKMRGKAHRCRDLARLGRAHANAAHAAYALCGNGAHMLALDCACRAVFFTDAAADAFLRRNGVKRKRRAFFLGIAGIAGHLNWTEAFGCLELFEELVQLCLIACKSRYKLVHFCLAALIALFCTAHCTELIFTFEFPQLFIHPMLVVLSITLAYESWKWYKET